MVGDAVTLLLVVLLALLWGVVIVPAILRARQDSSPIVTVGTFRKNMRALSSGLKSTPAGRWILLPTHPDDLVAPRKRRLERRKRLFAALVAAAATTLGLGLLPAMRDVLKLHLVLDLALAGYVWFLLQAKRRRPSDHTEQPESREQADDEYLRVGQL
jgi:hypothetical protein